MISESDLDVKLELKTVMDKIRTICMGKNKEITVSQLPVLKALCSTYHTHTLCIHTLYDFDHCGVLA